MLDISVKPLSKTYKTPSEILNFLKEPNIVEHKTDGVKLTLVKISETGDPLNDWLISYKGSLFYRGEFDYHTALESKTSMGNSQFKAVFDHLEGLPNTPEIPVFTELFCEFLVQKHTVMSSYTNTQQIILLGYGKASPQIRFGKINTNSKTMETSKRALYAKALRIHTPPLLSKGAWFPASTLVLSCLDLNLRRIVQKFLPQLKSLETSPAEYLSTVAEIFLTLESQFGGKEEGIIITNSKGLHKIQQDYQLDRDARMLKKSKYREDSQDDEDNYWVEVTTVASNLAEEALEYVDPLPYQQMTAKGINFIASKLKQIQLPKHSKKSIETIRDDIQFNSRMLFLKGLKGNNGSLVIGKFRVLTNGHCRMIEEAIKNSDDVVVGVVTGEKGKNTTSHDLRIQLIKKAFPNVKVISLSSGNIFTALKKADININSLWCGSDRITSYISQLKRMPGVDIKEVFRTQEDVSATKVIDNIEDQQYFRKNTPRVCWTMYDEIKSHYK